MVPEQVDRGISVATEFRLDGWLSTRKGVLLKNFENCPLTQFGRRSHQDGSN